jgi:hypothetical protein
MLQFERRPVSALLPPRTGTSLCTLIDTGAGVRKHQHDIATPLDKTREEDSRIGFLPRGIEDLCVFANVAYFEAVLLPLSFPSSTLLSMLQAGVWSAWFRDD